MQNGEIDKAAKQMLNTPQGIRIIALLDKLNRISGTESGKQLMDMLAGTGGDVIKQSAQAAKGAKSDRARAFVGNMMKTREGAALLAKIIEISGDNVV